MTTMQSGPWYGTFAFSYAPDMPQLTKMHLEVTPSLDATKHAVVKGRGEDGDGKFTVEGAVDGDTIRFTQKYDGEGEREAACVYAGTVGKNEITGRFRIVDRAQHGRFALKAGEPAEKPAAKSSEEIFVASSKKYAPWCTLDVEAVRFDGERDMFKALASDPDFIAAANDAHAADAVASDMPSSSSQKPAASKLMGRLRLSRAIYAPPFEALDRCTQALGLKAPVELLVANDGQVNAFVEKPVAGRIQITLTSGLLNTVSVDELAYVLGHELGHALLGHLETRVGGDQALSGVTQLRRLALARYQELSADRFGLLCCPDVDVAMRAEFMLHSGVVRREFVGDAQSIVKAAERAVAEGEGKANDAADGFVTHPAGAFRTLATWWFAHSQTFRDLHGASPKGSSGAILTEAELEKKVQALIDLMNPSILGDDSSDADVAELTALAGLAVAEAHEGASKKELRAIGKLSKPVAAALKKARALPFEERQLRVIDLAEKLSLTLIPAKRARILEDLAVVAQVDGHIAPEEVEALEGVAALMGMPGAVMVMTTTLTLD